MSSIGFVPAESLCPLQDIKRSVDSAWEYNSWTSPELLFSATEIVVKEFLPDYTIRVIERRTTVAEEELAQRAIGVFKEDVANATIKVFFVGATKEEGRKRYL